MPRSIIANPATFGGKPGPYGWRHVVKTDSGDLAEGNIYRHEGADLSPTDFELLVALSYINGYIVRIEG